MNSSSQNRSDRLFVFVGSMIPSYPISKDSKGYVRLKYKILEKTFGKYDRDTNLGGQFYLLYEGGQGGIVIFLTPEQYQDLKINELVIFAEDQ